MPHARALLALSALLAATAACSAHSDGRGTLTGTLETTYLGAGTPRPAHGTVTVTGPHGTQQVVADLGGRYSVRLEPGTYSVYGQTPMFVVNEAEAHCPNRTATSSTVTIRAGRTVTADLLCEA